MNEYVKKVKGFAKLEKGFDTYDGDPPSMKSRYMATRLLQALVDGQLLVYPDGQGGIEIDFVDGDSVNHPSTQFIIWVDKDGGVVPSLWVTQKPREGELDRQMVWSTPVNEEDEEQPLVKSRLTTYGNREVV